MLSNPLSHSPFVVRLKSSSHMQKFKGNQIRSWTLNFDQMRHYYCYFVCQLFLCRTVNHYDWRLSCKNEMLNDTNEKLSLWKCIFRSVLKWRMVQSSKFIRQRMRKRIVFIFKCDTRLSTAMQSIYNRLRSERNRWRLILSAFFSINFNCTKLVVNIINTNRSKLWILACVTQIVRFWKIISTRNLFS